MALPDANTDQTTPLQIAGVNAGVTSSQTNDQTQATPVQTQPVQPAQPSQAQPTQTDPHVVQASTFHRILSRIAGGDQQVVRDDRGQPVTNPQTGQVVTRTMGKRSLGASILAGALSAMAANEANQPYRNGNGVWVNPSNEAVRAGDQAFQASRPRNQIQAAQQQANDLRTQQYAIYKANVDQFKMTHDMYNIAAQDQVKAIEPYKDVVDQLRTGNVINPETGQSIYDPSLDNMSPAEAEAHLKKGDITRDMMIPVDSRPVLDANGNPTGRNELYWMALHGNANVKVTPEIISAHKELTGVNPNQSLPIINYLQLVRQASQSSIVGSVFQSVSDAVNKDFGEKGQQPVTLDFDKFKKDAHLTSTQLHNLLGLAQYQDNPDAVMAALDKQDPTLAGNVALAFRNQGVKIDLEQYKLKREADKKAAEDIKTDDPSKQLVDPAQVAALPQTLGQMYPKLPKSQIAAAMIGLGQNPNQGQLEKVTTQIQKMEENRVSESLRQQALVDKETVTKQGNDILETPDALGFTPNVPGGLKEYNKRQNALKKNLDETTKMDGTYQQFGSILNDINQGKDISGAQSVVALFNAIGISATPLAGKGFRINNNTVEEHANARGLGQSLYQKFLGLKEGDVITPQQIKDYASIAAETRVNQYVNLVNQAHNQGLGADFILPRGNGDKIDPNTAAIFFKLAGGNASKARQAAQAKGWVF